MIDGDDVWDGEEDWGGSRVFVTGRKIRLPPSNCVYRPLGKTFITEQKNQEI